MATAEFKYRFNVTTIQYKKVLLLLLYYIDIPMEHSCRKLVCNVNAVATFFLTSALSRRVFRPFPCHEAREEGVGERGQGHEDSGQLFHCSRRPVSRRTAGQDQDAAAEEEERAGCGILKSIELGE